MTDKVIAELLQKQNELIAQLIGGPPEEKQANWVDGFLGKSSFRVEQSDLRTKGLHTKAPANFSTYTPLHGPGGIWSSPAIERDVLNGYVRPRSLWNRLPAIATVNTNPLYGTLAGYTATTGTQPDNSCEDAPAGYVKGCTLTARFGLHRLDSQTIDMDDVMLKLSRGEHTDLVLRGQVMGMANIAPTELQSMSQGDILNVVSLSEMAIVGVNVERDLSRQLWQGSVALNQFPGLDSQIATGQLDAETGQACPAMDSDVKDFGYDLVGGNGRDIVEYMSMLEFYLRYNAQSMGLDPVTWVVVMRPELWFELSAVWPCAYNTNRCADAIIGTGSRVIIDGRENVMERDNMRNQLYIDINGNRYEVVLDTGINEATNITNANVGLGQYASSIYMVPLTINGGFPVAFREYLDYRQAQRDVSLTQNRLDAWWTNNGEFAWSLTQEKWCYKFHLKTQQRVVLRAPHIAGRIDNVLYEPLQHLREAYPDSPYNYDGGVSLRANAPNYSSVWG